MSASIDNGVQAGGMENESAAARESEIRDGIRNASPEALERLVTVYADRIYNTVFRMCGHAEDAREIAQETFCRAIGSAQNFQGRSSLYTWLYRIAVNLTVSHIRKNKRSRIISLDRRQIEDSNSSLHLNARQSTDPSNEASRKERVERVEDALQRLDESHRSVLVLRDVDGLNYARISEILDLPAGTVKSRLHRARMMLRDMLKDVLET
jgi:RNA polymerase sigma-70 factor (ECF subfamily)